jgi:hypothetical protein
MNRMRLSFVILLALLITLTMPQISAAAKGNPSANGGGTTIEGGQKSTFVFNAVKQKNGSVNGHMVYHFRSSDLTIYMTINCLKITGNNAVLSGVVTKVTGTAPAYIFVGQKAVFKVVDNGQGKGASPDLISDVILFSGANCMTSAPSPYLPIQGNIQVSS